MNTTQEKTQFFKTSIIYAAIALILIQPYFTWFYADDFCLIPKLKEKGMWETMMKDYLEWDGRSLSISYIISRIGLIYEINWIGPLIGTLMMVLTAYTLTRFNNSEDSGSKLQNTVFITVVLWLGSFYFISQTVYWSTGIGYTFEMLILTIFALMLERNKKNFEAKYLVLFILMGSFSPNAVLAALAVMLISFIYNKINRNEWYFKWFVYGALLMIGILVVVLTPGNGNRLPDKGVISNNITNPFMIYANFKWLFSSIIKFNTPITWVMAVVGLMGSTYKMNAMRKDGDKLLNKIVLWFWLNKWLIAAFISVYAFMPIPGFYAHSSRVNVHFYGFMAIYAVSNFDSLRQTVSPRVLKYVGQAFFAVFFVIISFQTFDAFITKKIMRDRTAFLKSMKGKKVVMTRDQMVNPPQTRDFMDISVDSSYWLNKCTCEYFELESIKREP